MLKKLKEIIFILFISMILFVFAFAIAELISRTYYKKSNYMNPLHQANRFSNEKLLQIYKKNGHEWIDEYLEEQSIINSNSDVNKSFKYVPFRIYQFDNKIKSKFFNTKNGNRPTYIYKDDNCKKLKKIFIYGGSTIHGDGWLRDKDLINSQLGEIMKNDNHTCYEIYNRGTSGYNSTQNFIRFFEDEIPQDSIYIFFDGINDFMHNYYGGIDHLWHNELIKFVEIYSLNENTLLLFLKKILLRSKFFQYLHENKIWNQDSILDTTKLEINELSKQKRITNLCNRWANRSLAINQMVRNNKGNAYFIWQIMIGDYKNLKPSDVMLQERTKKAFDEIFIKYESTRKLCQKTFGSNNIELINLPDDIYPEREMFIDFAHLMPYGNYVIAEQIYNVIKKDL